MLTKYPMKTFRYQWLLRPPLWPQLKLEYSVNRTEYTVTELDTNVVNGYPPLKMLYISFIKIWTYFSLIIRVLRSSYHKPQKIIHFHDEPNGSSPAFMRSPRNGLFFPSGGWAKQKLQNFIPNGKAFYIPSKAIVSWIQRGNIILVSFWF